MKKPMTVLCGAAALATLAFAAAAQSTEAPLAAPPVPVPPAAAPSDAPAAAVAAAPQVDEDNMADDLNKRQQLKQAFTFTRTVNGEVVETDTRSITYSRNDPIRTTETTVSPFDALKAKFDSELLSRTEAFREAKLDFTAADADRNGELTETEFVRLIAERRVFESVDAGKDGEDDARARQYRAFVEELDGETSEAAKAETTERAKKKFAVMAGSLPAIKKEEYLRAWLAEFDAVDANGDMMLRGEELMKFRALNRGESLS